MKRAQHSGPAKGHLILHGGGNIEQGEPFVSRFIELMGGPDKPVVYIPTALPDSALADGDFCAQLKQGLASHGLSNVTVLHTRNPNVAEAQEFVAPIRRARGIWMGGGRHDRLADAYLNTRTHRELWSLLGRGGVIAGDSAGATIQGSFLIRGDSYDHPLANLILLGDHQDGFGFLKNVVVDQHLLTRNRLFDIPKVQETYPELLGLGIDEHTAIVVIGNEFEVIGKSYVAVYDGTFWSGETGTAKDPSRPFFLLGSGSRYSMAEKRVLD